MFNFLKKDLKSNKFELLIDKKIFPIDIVLKASYNFLDKWYFFFKLDEKENIILQFLKKDNIKDKEENIVWDFSDELLNVYLRDKLEKDNKIIREAIVKAAIGNSLDSKNFVSIDTNNKREEEEKAKNNNDNNQIDFDKDIDEILKEIENDPDLKIDEKEIERILKEIEEETEEENKQNKKKSDNTKKIILDPKKVKDAKTKIKSNSNINKKSKSKSKK